MCGICGILNTENELVVNKENLIQMRDVLSHRGPDDYGLFIEKNIGLAHRRLSIIDLKGGHQPLSNEDGSMWIVYNGEIYNFQEIKNVLMNKGHLFKTNSDTETIVHAYEEYGVNCVEKFNGMFSFAIWDRNKKRLFLARDRLGIKPLYYYYDSKKFIFASEIKAILMHDEILPAVNPEAIEEYLVFRYIAGRLSLFKGIYRILPGEYAIWSKGELKKNIYWDLPVNSISEHKSEEEYIDELNHLLEKSVKLRLLSDVPLGAFSSGGVDSSLVTAYGAQALQEPIKTFAIGFEEEEWDERYFARLVAQKYNTDHREVVVSNSEFANAISKLIWYNDEPLSHPNSIQLYFLSKFAGRHVTVVLTGEGADEGFSGYPRHNIVRLFEYFSYLPSLFVRSFNSVLRKIPNRKIKKLSEGLGHNEAKDAVVYNSMFVNPMVAARVLVPSAPCSSYGYRNMFFENAGKNRTKLIEKLLEYEMKTYLVCLLERMDKMSMAVGLEARVPFLDHRLVEFILSIPWNYKLNKTRNKYILKKLALRKLPREVVTRPKSGLGVPLDDWVRSSHGLNEYLPLLRDNTLRDTGLFNQAGIGIIVDEHLKGQHNHGELIWLLINLRLWLDCLKAYKDSNLTSVDALAIPSS
ncbi:MAG: asparagine synthase (glutamine-hydrolyzing) [Candidatus Cloacimonas sp. 4484_209]|nr:MAG: asparagine synthase (glutamine-hydrolyzing) [Candidatus Cloacimonas sp. 4484_209]